ncbi:MAG: D-alanyl-D-alanine carboxypeptidase/D-alanyl-D-alanine-endopeptidase [Propionivibrio sp.]
MIRFFCCLSHSLTTTLLVALAVISSFTASAAENVLPAAVTRALKDAEIPLQSVGVVVHAVDTDQPLLSINAAQAMNPASVMKLVTTFAALELLGPAYTWSTELRTDVAPGPNPPIPGDGRLRGNLYVRGSGDPRLALEQFWLMLRQLRDHGIRDIDGDLVLDRSAFALPVHDPAEFDNEPLRPYNAGPDALMVNLKSVSLILHADNERQQVLVFSQTPSENLRIVNRLKLTVDACGDWRERFSTTTSGDEIDLAGTFSANCGDKALYLSPWPADRQVDKLFRALWRELGGSLHGQVRAGATPPDAQLLAVHESPALSEVAREINKYSNNVMARQLFLSLDAQRPATPQGADRRVQAWLAEKNLTMPELMLENGSGLSRSERLSADGLSRLLRAAWASPVMPEFIASLPLAGSDGTLRRRLGDNGIVGRAHLKTGYLNGVRAIAGYVQDSHDRRWVVVFLINDPRSGAGKPAMDELLRWVAAR